MRRVVYGDILQNSITFQSYSPRPTPASPPPRVTAVSRRRWRWRPRPGSPPPGEPKASDPYRRQQHHRDAFHVGSDGASALEAPPRVQLVPLVQHLSVRARERVAAAAAACFACFRVCTLSRAVTGAQLFCCVSFLAGERCGGGGEGGGNLVPVATGNVLFWL